MERYNFDQLFRVNDDGSITPSRTIRIGGAVIGTGITFRPGVQFSGVDIFQFRGRILAVEQREGGILEIMGFYE